MLKAKDRKYHRVTAYYTRHKIKTEKHFINALQLCRALL